MKAALLPIGLILLLATAPAALAQAPEQAAVNEAVIRQADQIALRQKLDEARAAQERHDLGTAAKLYHDGWTLVQRIGPDNIPQETAKTRAGLADVRLELGWAALRRADHEGADVNLRDVLRVDPGSAEALELKRANDKLAAAQAGNVPDKETKAMRPAILKEKQDAGAKVRDGQLLLQMGKVEEAEKKLKEAVAEDPQNQAAYYYLNLVNEARNKEARDRRAVASRKSLVEIEEAWAPSVKREALPVPNPYARTNLVFTSRGQQAINSKLDRIVLQSTPAWDGLPLSEVVKYLSEEARKRDPEKRGINFIINQNVDTGAASTVAAGTPGAAGAPGAPATTTAVDPATGLPMTAAPPVEVVDISQISIKIVPPLTDIRLADLLDAIVKVADKPIKYSIEDYAVVFSLKSHNNPPLYVRIIKVDPNTFEQGLQSVVSFDFGSIAQAQNQGGGGGGGGSSMMGSMGGGGMGGSSGAAWRRWRA